MWFNLRALTNDHAKIKECKSSHFSYSTVEHSSGDVSINALGKKSGFQTVEHGFCNSRREYIEQGATLKIFFDFKEPNAFPELKCGRVSYLTHTTSIQVSDPEYLAHVLKIVGTKYSIAPSLSSLLMCMIEDWLNMDSPKIAPSDQPQDDESVKAINKFLTCGLFELRAENYMPMDDFKQLHCEFRAASGNQISSCTSQHYDTVFEKHGLCTQLATKDYQGRRKSGLYVNGIDLCPHDDTMSFRSPATLSSSHEPPFKMCAINNGKELLPVHEPPFKIGAINDGELHDGEKTTLPFAKNLDAAHLHSVGTVSLASDQVEKRHIEGDAMYTKKRMRVVALRENRLVLKA